MNPLVSIGVPIYNVESYIERCARSLFEQTYVHIEYIFIDDNSPDDNFESTGTWCENPDPGRTHSGIDYTGNRRTVQRTDSLKRTGLHHDLYFS